MTTLEQALAYARAGLSVIPIKPDGSKAPALPAWKEFQDHRASEEQIRSWFGNGKSYGVGIVCGAVSGNLEVLDFDGAELWHEFETSYRDALEEIPLVLTPAGGAHLYLFRSAAGPNRKLVRNKDGKTLAEIRGEGGYVLAPGGPAECHPSGKLYQWIHPLPAR